MIARAGSTIRINKGNWTVAQRAITFTKSDVVQERPNTVVVRLKRENEHMTFGHVKIEIQRAHIAAK